MSSGTVEQRGDAAVTVREFVSAPDLGLQLEPVQAAEGMDKLIVSPRIQKLGLALAGYCEYLHLGRVQILGGSEVNYLAILSPRERRRALNGLRGRGMCCIIATRGLPVPEDLLEVARAEKIPVFRTGALSSEAISRIGAYLDVRLAPRMGVHGVLLSVYGLGIMLLGPSGIGKSECGLELILRGHRLVADDLVEIRRRGIDRLEGSGGPRLRYHMELRGLGIIDIKELFGISATEERHSIDLVIRLGRWKAEDELDRLGVEPETVEYLGVPVPLIEVPVEPGRNVATLVEVAARVHLLRRRGIVPSRELAEKGFPRPASDRGSNGEAS